MLPASTPVLNAIRDGILSITPAAPATPISRAYTEPEQYTDVIPRIPFAIIRKELAQPVSYDTGDYSATTVTRRFGVEVFVHLIAGSHTFPSKSAADAEQMIDSWASALAGWLLENGDNLAGASIQLPFEIALQQLYWEQEAMGIAVTMTVEQLVSI